MGKKETTDTFCVSFDTESMPGVVIATEITIRTRIMRDNDEARIDLCALPLYEGLSRYVQSNPYRNGK